MSPAVQGWPFVRRYRGDWGESGQKLGLVRRQLLEGRGRRRAYGDPKVMPKSDVRDDEDSILGTP